MAAEIALVHLGTGLDFLGLGIDQVPPQLLEEILTSYPRLIFKSAFRDLLVEHRRRNPAAQILTWTDEIARTAGCTLHGQPIPTASQVDARCAFCRVTWLEAKPLRLELGVTQWAARPPRKLEAQRSLFSGIRSGS
jgi:hypothetical protein